MLARVFTFSTRSAADLTKDGNRWIRTARLGTLIAVGAGACLPGAVLAYIGPGAGITLLGALIAVGAAVLVAVGGVVLWPLRAYLRKRRGVAAPTSAETPPASHPPSGEAGAGGAGDEE